MTEIDEGWRTHRAVRRSNGSEAHAPGSMSGGEADDVAETMRSVVGLPSAAAARQQAEQDVHEVAMFLARVDQRQRVGQRVPDAKPMKEILGSFREVPRDLIRVQVLAAAATARHLEGAQSMSARRWQQLAQDNAARLDALRGLGGRRDSVADLSGVVTAGQAAKRDAQNDRRIFDASAALAMGYVAARGLPAFDTLSELSGRVLDIGGLPKSVDSTPVRVVPERDVDESPELADPGEQSIDDAPMAGLDETPDRRRDTESEVTRDCAATARSGPESQTGGVDVDRMRDALNRAGHGIAQAVGPVSGDDEVVPAMAPVNLVHLTEELLGALGAVGQGHLQSVAEMLSSGRAAESTRDAAYVRGLEVEQDRDRSVAL
ncbi:hypothetical protein [Rhodococcus triatomae]